MVLFLAVIGGAVVLEVHRALHHNGNPDVKDLREREAALRKQLQVAVAARRWLSAVGRPQSPSLRPASRLEARRSRAGRSCAPVNTGAACRRHGCRRRLPDPPPPAPCPLPGPQDIQRDLKAAQQQRELTEAEAAQLSAINQRLCAENQGLTAQASSLKEENAELLARSASLLERQVRRGARTGAYAGALSNARAQAAPHCPHLLPRSLPTPAGGPGGCRRELEG